MKLYLNVKQAGARKNYIAKEEIILNLKPLSARDLIKEIVTIYVNKYNNGIKNKSLIKYLIEDEIESKAEIGRINFGEIYNETQENLEKAIERAYLAYEDGIFTIFIQDKEVKKIDENIEIKEGDTLTFIKFIMLAGAMW